MVVRGLVAAVVLWAGTTFSVGARAAEPSRCSLGRQYPVRSVGRYETFEDAGYTSYTLLRGAELIVPAQPGLTREWLQRVLTVQVAAGDCDFGVPDATVSVLPRGDAFSVRIGGHDERAGAEILRQAERMMK